MSAPAPSLQWCLSWPPAGTPCCLCNTRFLGVGNGRPWRVVRIDVQGVAAVAHVCAAEFPPDGPHFDVAHVRRSAHLFARIARAIEPGRLTLTHGGFHG